MHSSLWLTPTPGNPFTTVLAELITDTVPGNFPVATQKTIPKFSPHVTLTSDIDPAKTYNSPGSSTTAQQWLDSLELPAFKKEKYEPQVELDEVEVGEEYFKKITIRCSKEKGLLELAKAARRQGVLETKGEGNTDGEAEKWAEAEYKPHLSLMYGDVSLKDAKAKLGLVELQVGFGLGSLFDCCGGTLSMGGNLVLVDTGKGKEDVEGWKVLAERKVEWLQWRMTRNLV